MLSVDWVFFVVCVFFFFFKCSYLHEGMHSNEFPLEFCSVEDEKESSSSEEEEDDRRRLSDDLLGKVALIQTGPDQECWFHALVSSSRLSELAY